MRGPGAGKRIARGSCARQKAWLAKENAAASKGAAYLSSGISASRGALFRFDGDQIGRSGSAIVLDEVRLNLDFINVAAQIDSVDRVASSYAHP